jgi:hypothetical protein
MYTTEASNNMTLCHYIKGLRPLINHVSAEGLTTKRMISSEKNSPPTDSNKNVYILSMPERYKKSISTILFCIWTLYFCEIHFNIDVLAMLSIM